MVNRQAFSPFPWQAPQWQQLQSRLIAQKLPHAILLTGPKGLGKLHFAESFARSILCTNRQPNGLYCTKCRQCLLINAGTHPDLFHIQPLEARHLIKIEQIRALSDVTVQTSPISSSKVVIIEPAEAMTIGSSNALLKSLEEPQETVYFLLVSHEFQRLPATIVSRCQKTFFQPSFAPAIQQWLQEQLPGETNTEHLLQWSFGAPLSALAMSDKKYQQARQDFMQDWCALLSGEIHTVNLCEKWHKYDILKVIDWILKWVTDLLYQCAAMKPLETVSLTSLYLFYDNLLENKQFIAKSSALNQQLLVESLFLQGALLQRGENGR